MKRALISRKLAEAILALVALLYFILKTTSPKIIFAPFLICCIASIGKNLGILLNQIQIALIFDRLFKIVFFLWWFIFLIAASYIAISSKNYKLIFFTLPFWFGGLFFMKRKILNKKG